MSLSSGTCTRKNCLNSSLDIRAKAEITVTLIRTDTTKSSEAHHQQSPPVQTVLESLSCIPFDFSPWDWMNKKQWKPWRWNKNRGSWNIKENGIITLCIFNQVFWKPLVKTQWFLHPMKKCNKLWLIPSTFPPRWMNEKMVWLNKWLQEIAIQ